MSAGIMSERCDSLKTAWQLMFPIAGAAAVRRFARDSRGAAALELALGAVTLVATAALCFDIYSRITADTALARMAVTMADYISLEVDPEEEQMRALGEFLNEHELGVPADLVYVVTAIHQPPGSPPPAVQVLWKHDQIQIGNTAITAALATDCARHVDAGNVRQAAGRLRHAGERGGDHLRGLRPPDGSGLADGHVRRRRHLSFARAAVPRFQPVAGSTGLNLNRTVNWTE